jgi:replicative DNA helicase
LTAGFLIDNLKNMGRTSNINNLNKNLDKLPPQSIEAEQSVLGSILIDKKAIVKIGDILTARDFYRDTHGMIFETMIELFEKNEPIDIMTVSNRLEEKKVLEKIGDSSYLTELVNTVPTAANVVKYAKIVQKKKMLRDLIDAAHNITRLGYQEEEDLEKVLDEAEKNIFEVSQRSIKQFFMPIKPALEEAFERIDLLHKNEGGALRGIPTGFTDLDNILAGLQKSDYILLAARPSLGKTTLGLDIVRNVAVKHKIPVGIFSLEMSSAQLVDRLLCAQAEIDLWKLRTGRLSSKGEENDFTKIQEAIGILSESPIFIDDSPSSTVMEIKTKARRLQAEHGLGLILVDYIQLIMPSETRENIVQQMTEISRSLKTLARELNVPLIAISQLSRATEQRSPRIPRLADLRESGSLEQDADVVLLIYREDLDMKQSERKNRADIFIAKHRNGPIGQVELYFNQDQVTFKNLAKNYEE